MRRATEAWMREAQDELETAAILLERDKPRGACLHSQQCAEKALKAVLLEKGKRLPSSRRTRPEREQLCRHGSADDAPVAARDQDIATILAMSPRTVQRHVTRIHDTFRVETRNAAVALALQASSDPHVT